MIPSRRMYRQSGVCGLVVLLLANLWGLHRNLYQSLYKKSEPEFNTAEISFRIPSKRDHTDINETSNDSASHIENMVFPTNRFQDPIAPNFLNDHILRVSEGCGQTCNTSIKGIKGRFFDQIRKDINCPGLWANAAIDDSREAGPAPLMPESLRVFYSFNGKVEIVNKKLSNLQYLDSHAMSPLWKKEKVVQWTQDCLAGRLPGNYGIKATQEVLKGLKRMPSLVGGHVLVIGSENPWIEACILGAGARHVTTLEYGSIISEHPQISTMTPRDARAAFANRTLPLFDSVVTYSSVEHSGLGRYGDQLNPWGDLQAIARAWCICRSGGHLLLGVQDNLTGLTCTQV